MSLTCRICNHIAEKSLTLHITKFHKITCDEYRKEYGENLVLRITDKNYGDFRPAKRKQISIWKKEYWIERHGFTEEEAIKKVSEIQSLNAKLQPKLPQFWINKGFSEEEAKLKSYEFANSLSIWSPTYWINKGFSEEEAKKEVFKIQSTSSAKSSKFKGKKHSFESKKQIAETWFRNMKESGNVNNSRFGLFQSKIEISCFLKIQESICPDLKSNVIIGGKVVDMVFGSKIIEFNGDFWHANPKDYNESQILSFPGKKKLVSEIWQKDKERDEYLIEKGYEIFVIWESDWNNKMEEVLVEVKKYLYDL